MSDWASDFKAAVDATAAFIAEKDIGVERARADQWMKQGRKYDDIRDWLRIYEDTPEGHAQFYNECARIIFGEPEEGE